MSHLVASLVADPSKLPDVIVTIVEQSFDFALTIFRLTISGGSLW